MSNKRKIEKTRSVWKKFVQLSRLAVRSGVVDVRGDGGLFQQGMIVDCTEEGLMIDWGCHGEPASQVIPFGEIYYYNPLNFREKNTVAEGRTSVEVMMRRSPQEPRTWYPGKLLYGSLGSPMRFHLVEVALPDGALAIVVPGHRIRRPLTDASLETLRVQQGQLVKCNVPLLGRCTRGTSLQQVVDIWNRGAWNREYAFQLFRAVRMDSETLEFITIASHLLPLEIKTVATTALHELDILLNKAAKGSSRLQRQLKRKLSETDLESSEEDIDPEMSNNIVLILRMEILKIVFDYSDSVEQHRLRRVCVYWNCILTSTTVTRVLRVHYDNKKQNYLSAASLHHGWTAQTKFIIHANVNANRSALSCGGQFCRTLLQHGLHAPVQRLVLSNVVFSVPAGEHHPKDPTFIGTLGRLVDELNGLSAVCHCLSLYNVTVNLGSGIRPLKSASLRILTAQITGCLTVKELWSRMDNSLPPLDPAQLENMMELMSNMDQSFLPRILNVLNEGRNIDPSCNGEIGNRFWTVDDLPRLDLLRLSKLTLHRLHALWVATSIECVMSW